MDLPHTRRSGAHTMFRAGNPVRCAGILTINGGRIVAINNHSGHYLPSPRHFVAAMVHLTRAGFLGEHTAMECFALPLDGAPRDLRPEIFARARTAVG
jgi:hypothetical protein